MESNLYNLPVWPRAIEKVYGFKTYDLCALDNSGLSLTHVKSRFFKNILVNAPYRALSDPIINSGQGFHETMEKAMALSEKTNANYIELRSSKPLDLDLPVITTDVIFTIDLSGGVDHVFRNIKRNVRNAIRKGQKNNLYYKIGPEYLPTFFDIYSKSVRRLGTPTHSLRFFRELLQFRNHFNIVIIFNKEHVPVSGGFIGEDEEAIYGLWEGGLIEYNHLSPGNFHCWSLIEYACQKGKKIFDFGRSSKNTGTYDFKKGWFSQEIQLYYYYYFRKKSRITQRESQEYKAFSSLWRRTPLFITRRAGPILRKYIP